MSESVFVLVDGDNVGEKIDLLVLQEDLQGVSEFTRGLDRAVDLIEAAAREAGGTVYIAGGDNVLARLDDLDAFLEKFGALQGELGGTFSVGIGREAKDAHVALKVAKSRGPGTIVRARAEDGELAFARREAGGAWAPVDDRAPLQESKYASRKRR